MLDFFRYALVLVGAYIIVTDAVLAFRILRGSREGPKAGGDAMKEATGLFVTGLVVALPLFIVGWLTAEERFAGTSQGAIIATVVITVAYLYFGNRYLRKSR